MIKVKVPYERLKEYFSDHYDFENNPGLYFSKLEYDLESDLHQKEYILKYKQILELCREFDCEQYIDEFFNLYFIARITKFRKDSLKLNHSRDRVEIKSNIDYKQDIFSLFKLVFENKLSGNHPETIKSITVNTNKFEFILTGNNIKNYKSKRIEDSEHLTCLSPIFIERFELFILNEVSQLLLGKDWYDIDSGMPEPGKTNELTEIIKSVDEWLSDWEKKSKEKTHFISLFLADVNQFILNSLKPEFALKQDLSLFIGKLFVIYELFVPKPGQLINDRYFIKTTENHFPKKRPKNK